MMSDRDVEDVDLLVIAAARRENHWRWTVLRRAGRSPWSSGQDRWDLLCSSSARGRASADSAP
jgi:hypothetical protein